MRNPNDATLASLSVFQNKQIKADITKNSIFVNILIIIDNNTTNKYVDPCFVVLWYSSGCLQNDPTLHYPEICKLGAVNKKYLIWSVSQYAQ